MIEKGVILLKKIVWPKQMREDKPELTQRKIKQVSEPMVALKKHGVEHLISTAKDRNKK